MVININDDTELIKKIIINIIYQKKGHNIVTSNVQNRTIIAKYMIITSCDSHHHVKALGKYLIKYLKPHNRIDIEGMNEGNWIIINYQDIMVHIFRAEVREYYKIDELWN